MPDSSPPRVALLGFSIECNNFAPVATKAHFLARTYLKDDAIIEDARSPTPHMLPETPGFIEAMDASGAWTPVGIALAMTEPNGPVEHAFFVELLATIEHRLRAALPVDAVYICSHGAALTTGEDDPDGVLFAKVREIVGPDVPIAATLDLHANVSERMVNSVDAFIGYRTNPHLDIRERGAEAAAAVREMLAGVKPQRAFLRLPIVPPTVTLLTAAGPYAEMIALGQRRMNPEIMNVSAMGGFAFADAPDCGLSVVVTARRDKQAGRCARDRRARWAGRGLSAPDFIERPSREALAVAAMAARRSPLPMSPTTPAAAGAATTFRHAPFTRQVSRARCSACSTMISPARAYRGVGARFRVQPLGDHPFLGALHRACRGHCANRRQLCRPPRYLFRIAARTRAVRCDQARRDYRRRDLASGAMRRPGIFRDDGARHRPGALDRGKVRAISAAALTNSSAPSRSSRSISPA
jgi:hypothetical protein